MSAWKQTYTDMTIIHHSGRASCGMYKPRNIVATVHNYTNTISAVIIDEYSLQRKSVNQTFLDFYQTINTQTESDTSLALIQSAEAMRIYTLWVKKQPSLASRLVSVSMQLSGKHVFEWGTSGGDHWDRSDHRWMLFLWWSDWLIGECVWFRPIFLPDSASDPPFYRRYQWYANMYSTKLVKFTLFFIG